MHTTGVWAATSTRPFVVLGRMQRGLRPHTPLPVRWRRSGGGAVLDGPWMLRTLVRLPRDHALAAHGPAPLALWAGRRHLDWLAAQGVTGAALYEGPAIEHWACFAGRVPGEVMVHRRKLVGIAQCWTSRGIALWTGTLLQAPPWDLLAQALGRDDEASALAGAAIALDACAPAVAAPACAASLRGVLCRALAPHQHAAAAEA